VSTLTYYLAFMAVWHLVGRGLDYPSLLAGAALLLLVRRWLPDPYRYVKHRRLIARLRSEIAQNPDNATARRDLAVIWIAKGRPRRALFLIDQALARDSESTELLFLRGKALLGCGDAAGALDPLIRAARRNERHAYGEAYLIAGRALEAMRRSAEAEDAYERYVAINSSSVEGHVRLARSRRGRDADGVRRALGEAIDTFGQIPAFRRRKELGWYLCAQLMRVGLA
jgi:tetratricopeptide (TPR) repeat protein